MSELTSTFCDYCNEEMDAGKERGYLQWQDHDGAIKEHDWIEHPEGSCQIMCMECQEEKGLFDEALPT